MANAKMCDICGNFYVVPEVEAGSFWEESMNGNVVRIMRRKKTERIEHDIMQYDACEKCLQDVTDFILSKAAVSTGTVAE